jgi:hypothetical protein
LRNVKYSYVEIIIIIIELNAIKFLFMYNNNNDNSTKFWKYVSNFRNHRSGSVKLVVACTRLVHPSAAADAFAKHFQSVHNNHCPMDSPPPPPSVVALNPALGKC